MLRYWKLSTIYIFMGFAAAKDSKSTPCKWDSKTGAKFDLRPLILPANTDGAPYRILDGDIPCTPEIEPSFKYAWNFCASLPPKSVPETCTAMGKNGVVLQFLDSANSCYIIGHFDASQHLLEYGLLDVNDPSKGLSISYPPGETCSQAHPNVLRKSTINVECANVESVVVSAQEPSLCHYHIDMKSFYGCPTTCPITSNGLCDSHGHCAYDPVAKASYCYCNEGHYGDSCSSTTYSGSTTYDGFSVQLGLLVTLLIVALGLTGGVIYMAYQISEFRKQQISNNYSSLPGGENEMVETVNFN